MQVKPFHNLLTCPQAHLGRRLALIEMPLDRIKQLLLVEEVEKQSLPFVFDYFFDWRCA